MRLMTLGAVLAMAVVATVGCSGESSHWEADTATLDPDEESSESLPLQIHDEEVQELVELGQSIVEYLMTLPDEQTRVDYLMSLTTDVTDDGAHARTPRKAAACVGGAIVVGAAVGGCVGGNPWACVAAIGGAIKFADECLPEGSDGPIADPCGGVDCGGCVGHLCKT